MQADLHAGDGDSPYGFHVRRRQAHHGADLATPCIASAGPGLYQPLMHPRTLVDPIARSFSLSRHQGGCHHLLDFIIARLRTSFAWMHGTSILSSFPLRISACISMFTKEIPSLVIPARFANYVPRQQPVVRSSLRINSRL
ncbi:hypothetical protein VPH35_020092 [Triticum aestivum]